MRLPSPNGRRIRSLLFSPFFTTPIIVLIIALISYISIISPLAKKRQTQLSSPAPASSDALTVSLISYIPQSTDSATLWMEQLQATKQTPFDTLSLLPDGQLTPLSATDSTPQLIILVNNRLPKQETLQSYYQLTKLIRQNNLSVQHLWADHQYLSVFLSDSLLAILNPLISPQTLLDTLQQIRTHSTMNLTGAIIDLRFDKPVITLDQIK